MPNYEENRETKTIFGNREHKKTHFQFFGEKGNKPIYFRETREQVSPGRVPSTQGPRSDEHTQRVYR